MPKCKDCYYGDECKEGQEDCSYYTPFVDEYTDEQIDHIHREKKKDYYNEYLEYISEFN